MITLVRPKLWEGKFGCLYRKVEQLEEGFSYWERIEINRFLWIRYYKGFGKFKAYDCGFTEAVRDHKYCQREIEMLSRCEYQCNHCSIYYKPLEDEARSSDTDNSRP